MNFDNEETLKVKGDVIIVKTDEFGNQEVSEHKNLVVTVGKAYIASRMTANGNVMTHMAVGTDGTSAAAGDTGLAVEAARVALSVSGGTPSANTVTYAATFPAGTPAGTSGLQEAGIFTESSGGRMLCRTTFPVVNKQASDIVSISWVISIT